MVLTLEQRIFIVDCYRETKSYGKCAEMFAEEFQVGTALMRPTTRATMKKVVVKWHETGSVDNRKKNRQNSVRTKENVAMVQGIMEENPNTSMRRLSALTGISSMPCVRILKEDLHLHCYRYTRVQELKPEDFQQRIDFCQWFLGELDSATP